MTSSQWMLKFLLMKHLLDMYNIVFMDSILMRNYCLQILTLCLVFLKLVLGEERGMAIPIGKGCGHISSLPRCLLRGVLILLWFWLTPVKDNEKGKWLKTNLTKKCCNY